MTSRRTPFVSLSWLSGALLAPTVVYAIGSHLPPADVVFPPNFPRATASSTQRLARIPPNMRAEPVSSGVWKVTFVLSASAVGAAQSAKVAGSFTGWQGQALPMLRSADGSFTVTANLPAGTHRYKFILDESNWISDPANGNGLPDGNGGTNSVIDLGADACLDASQAQRGDGAIEGLAFVHDPKRPADRERSASGWTVRSCSLRGDVEGVDLYWKSAEITGVAPMRRCGSRGPYDLWETVLPAAGSAAVFYTFVAKDGQLTVSDPNIYSLNPADDASFRTPDWAKNAVWYQVMVDRFRNGDPANDSSGTMPWKHDWYKPYGAEGQDGQTFYKHFVFSRFAGGDIAGLRSKLPYLKELGINALYLMPMFEASTPHKYNTTNYIHIDEHFGTRGDYQEAAASEDLLDPATWKFTPSDRAFLELIRHAKSMGFRVIIDGVFNHSGTAHPAFQDVKQRGKQSKFADWFDITSWDPFAYQAWWGFSELPVFKKDQEHGLASESLRQHIYAITRRWMDPDGDGDPSDGVDGWRLDVPNEVPLPFWHDWCKFVRSINPDAYIAGEIWEKADLWLDGKSFDGVMNYQFAKPAIRWVIDRANKISASAFNDALAQLRQSHPAECNFAMMNLVSSHDTDRVASMARNPDRVYNQKNREQENDPYDASKPSVSDYNKQKLLALLQMTYLGAPMVYYGDEFGLWGSNDPNNRKPMPWEDLGSFEDPQMIANRDILNHYRTVIALRNAHPALRTGSYQTVLVDDAQDVLCFLRQHSSEEILVALNASERPATLSLLDQGDGWQDLYGTPGFADNGMANITVPAQGGRMWRRVRK